MESFALTPGFCPVCGSIFPVLNNNIDVTCYTCKQVFKADVFGNQVLEYTTHFNSCDLENLNRMDNTTESEGPIVDRKCSKCDYGKMSYATLQLRSADEGQTVFFTCLKCKFKEVENS